MLRVKVWCHFVAVVLTICWS